jgi:hypothetical protein
VSGAGDRAAWTALIAELDQWQAAGRGATVWWRDDDAGRAHPAFARLLALATRIPVPLALAVVPAWLEDPVAADLDAAPGRLAVLQHGAAHRNHEPPGAAETRGKPAECGAGRPPAVVLAELAEAGARLRRRLGARCLPVLVPPWNRVDPGVTVGLPAHGYRGLSTFGARPTATPTGALQQVNCHVDPIVWRDRKRFAGIAASLEGLRRHLADRRAGRVDSEEPTGLLTHHRELSEAGWAWLETLLDRLRAHPAVAFPPARTLFGLPAG